MIEAPLEEDIIIGSPNGYVGLKETYHIPNEFKIFGKCSVCGVLNTDEVVCNCANKKLFQVNTATTGLKFDNGKLLYSLIPPETTKALAEVLTYGAQKYAPNNWQLVENGEVRYLDALFRHLEAYRAGEQVDPESGLPHLSHVLTNVAFLHYLTQTKKEQ